MDRRPIDGACTEHAPSVRYLESDVKISVTSSFMRYVWRVRIQLKAAAWLKSQPDNGKIDRWKLRIRRSYEKHCWRPFPKTPICKVVDFWVSFPTQSKFWLLGLVGWVGHPVKARLLDESLMMRHLSDVKISDASSFMRYVWRARIQVKAAASPSVIWPPLHLGDLEEDRQHKIISAKGITMLTWWS